MRQLNCFSAVELVQSNWTSSFELVQMITVGAIGLTSA